MARFRTRLTALALGVAAATTATPALAYCYKFENKSPYPRTMVIHGSGGIRATVAPAATWPDRGEYCVYGMTVIVTVEPPGRIESSTPLPFDPKRETEELGASFTAGDSPTAQKPGTYILK